MTSTLTKKRYMMVSLGFLLEDLSIYPRPVIDEVNVTKLFKLLNLGIELDPICIVKETGQILDGIHRNRALKRYYRDSPAIKIRVEVMSISTELGKIDEASKRNLIHGKQLTSVDRAHAYALMVQKEGFSQEHCAEVLNMSMKDLLKMIGERFAKMPGLVRDQWEANDKNETDASSFINAAKDIHGDIVFLKRPVLHMANTVFTMAQVEINGTLVGSSQSHLFKQVIGLLRENMVNTNDKFVMSRIEELKKVLVKW